jgi:hypothetical protein
MARMWHSPPISGLVHSTRNGHPSCSNYRYYHGRGPRRGFLTAAPPARAPLGTSPHGLPALRRGDIGIDLFAAGNTIVTNAPGWAGIRRKLQDSKRPVLLSITHKLSTEQETHLDVS